MSVVREKGRLASVNTAPARKPRIYPVLPAEHVYWPRDFWQICTSCKQLERLSCACPSTSFMKALSDDWQAVSRTILPIRDLVTLHITTWRTANHAVGSRRRKLLNRNFKRLPIDFLLHRQQRATYAQPARGRGRGGHGEGK